MLVPEASAERRLTHKGNVSCRLHIDWALMVKVIIENVSLDYKGLKVGDELQFTKSQWEKYPIKID